MATKFKLPQKTPLIIGVFIVGTLVGGGASYALFNEKDPEPLTPLTDTTTTPVLTKQETGVDDNVSKEALSPHTVATEAYKYIGKEITVKGTLLQPNPDAYIVSSLDQKNAMGLAVDFSKSNIDPKKYLVSTSTIASETQPATPKSNTFTGKLTETKTDLGVVFKLEVTQVN